MEFKHNVKRKRDIYDDDEHYLSDESDFYGIQNFIRDVSNIIIYDDQAPLPPKHGITNKRVHLTR